MTKSLEEEINRLVESMDNQEHQEPEIETPPQDKIQDIYVLIVREGIEVPEDTKVVDSTPTETTQPAPVSVKKDPFISAYMFICFSLFLIFSTLAFQLFCLFNPQIATITIIPKSQQVTLTGTLQLGRVLPPLTLSQSQTTKVTGHGHQDARAATGYLTFYNGQFQSVTIPAGTILTGASGIQVVTDQDALIPAASPPSFGFTTVAAHASNAGRNGNIPAYDINEACCATSVLAKNTGAFTGGQDERTYTTVTHNDIHNISTVLKTTLAQSAAGAFQGQLKQGEILQLLPCSPTVTSDHQPGQEATTVNVTVSQTCSAVVFNTQTLAEKATALLSTQALQITGAGYSLFGTVHILVKQATVTNTQHHLVFLSIQASGTWIYALSQQSQQQIKHLIAGKTTREARELLSSLPGVESAAIRFSGFGDASRIPKTAGYIDVIVIVV